MMGVVVTESAVKRIARILAGEPDKTALRISVEGGGCSGFSYKYDLVNEPPAEDDLVIKKDGATILIDSMSLPLMDGSEIDFVDNLLGQAFKINNPNAVSSCGCGASFSI
ncbi:iron-sulfur cluster assembly accessory protein [Bartonella sp. B10834H15]|nr:iron-sulfur cluster assembly accessory protein [Bartonella choladocola]MBH9975506.1 iron-sulfur cluster assembly accessory protein [Bartonella choladocola]MBI0015113.1 iron-sulfur cluster assembly accessory protein [Bartonella sp. B10834G3]MBI0140693.1 iron-sulfur cluster assembly accessory protein [Bartonella choladocola]